MDSYVSMNYSQLLETKDVKYLLSNQHDLQMATTINYDI